MPDSLLPVTAPVETPTSARDALADRFLARVSALTPRQWGELDAIGQRFEASDPASVWRRARHLAAFAGQAPAVVQDVATVIGFVALGLTDLATATGLRRRTSLVHTRLPSGASSDSRQLVSRIETLRDVAAHQPAGARQAFDVLAIALTALWVRDAISAAASDRLYALVEPVIPLASL